MRHDKSAIRRPLRRPKQLALEYRTRGGARRNAGRKPKGARAGVPHRQRERITSPHPLHVTLRLRRELGSLRARTPYLALLAAWEKGHTAEGFRLVHHSVQHDHIHLIIEAADTTLLSRRMQGLCIRMAQSLNRTLRRRGSVFADRYHARVLRTPREVRNALVYVLCNHRKHAAEHGRTLGAGFDPFSSAPHFDGWREGPIALLERSARASPVARASCWLLTVGWRKHGLPSLREVPGGGGRRR